jgi:uncharacterized membrane protein YozB (DUF420 family)
VSLASLPALNAGLNGTSAALLLSGYLLIRAGRRQAHMAFMLAAVLSSSIFLASYLYYHAHVGSVPFHGQGALRAVYFFILTTHTLLAVTIVPLVLVTLTRALRGHYAAHRRIARFTLPLWAYVSVTGVVVYWMLYRL